jgi:hypothetical protein
VTDTSMFFFEYYIMITRVKVRNLCVLLVRVLHYGYQTVYFKRCKYAIAVMPMPCKHKHIHTPFSLIITHTLIQHTHTHTKYFITLKAFHFFPNPVQSYQLWASFRSRVSNIPSYRCKKSRTRPIGHCSVQANSTTSSNRSQPFCSE